MRQTSRRRGFVTFLFSIGVLTLILTLGVGSTGTSDAAVQVQARERWQDVAQNAAMSGIFYARRMVNEMIFACNDNQNDCPGDNSPLPDGTWSAEAWMGLHTPGPHRNWGTRKGPDVRYVLPRIDSTTPGRPLAWVYFTLSLDEALARSNYFYSTEDVLNPSTICCTPNGFTTVGAPSSPYLPEEVLYTLTSTGEVQLAHPEDANQAAARPVSRALATLRFRIPITVRPAGSLPNIYNELDRDYNDLSLEISETAF